MNHSAKMKPCFRLMKNEARMPGLINREVDAGIIVGIAIVSFIISELVLYRLSGGTHLLLAQLLYFPVILAAFEYPRWGVFSAVGIGLFYIAIVVLLLAPRTLQIIPASAQFSVYITAGIVISSLSGQVKVNETGYSDTSKSSGNATSLPDFTPCGVFDEAGRRGEPNESGCLQHLSGLISGSIGSEEVQKALESIRQRGSDQETDSSILLAGNSEGGARSDDKIPVYCSNLNVHTRAEREFAERENLFHCLADTMLDASVIFDLGGTILFCNRAATELLDIASGEELIGRNIREFLAPEYYSVLSENIHAVLSDKGGFLEVYQLITESDDVKWIEAYGSKIEFRKQPAVTATIRDITTRKNAEKTAWVQRDLEIALASTSSVERACDVCLEGAVEIHGVDCGAIYILDGRTGDFELFTSKNISRDFHEPVHRYVCNLDRAHCPVKIDPVYTGYSSFISVYGDAAAETQLRGIGLIPICQKNRVIGCFSIASCKYEEIPLESRIVLETIANQLGSALMRIRAEESILKVKREMRSLFDFLEDFILVVDGHGKIISANQAFVRLTGHSAEDLKTMALPDLFSSACRDKAAAVMEEMVKGTDEFFELPLMDHNGVEIPIAVRGVPGLWGDREVLFVISRDAEQKPAEMLRCRNALLKFSEL